MKFESLMLQSLFTACLLICVLTLGAMLTPRHFAPNAVTGEPTPIAATVDAARGAG